MGFGWRQGAQAEGVPSLFNGSLFSLFQRLGIFMSGAGMNQGSWPCPAGAWQRTDRQSKGKVRVNS